jgi:hypothetical protein
MRMRKRRIERCLLRASVALEAGVLEDARESIEEARRLSPDDPDVEQLAQDLVRAEHPPPVTATEPLQEERAAPAARRLAAAAVLTVSCGVGGWWWTSARHAAPPEHLEAAAVSGPIVQPASATPADEPSVRVSEMAVAAPVVITDSRAPEPPSTSATAASASRVESPAASASPPTRDVPARAQLPAAPAAISSRPDTGNPGLDPRTDRSERTFATPPARAGVSTLPAPGPSAAAPTIAPKLDVLPDLPETPPPAPRVIAGADGINAPDSAARIPTTVAPAPAPVTPAAAAAPAPPARSEEQNIRAVLSRYESAYSRLDAAAAGSVWPGVNERALASAFQGLSAQTISLGQCDIRVSSGTAHAECSGNARWTPKVGGGTQSAARQWRFDLRNAGGSWVITQATTR